MAFDVYGNHLKPGYCEVHPDVREEYPCSECIGESHRPEPIREPEPTIEDMCNHQYYGCDENGGRCYCGNKRYAFCMSCDSPIPAEQKFCASCKDIKRHANVMEKEARNNATD